MNVIPIKQKHLGNKKKSTPPIMAGPSVIIIADIFPDFGQINMGHGCFLAIEDLGQLFKSRATSLNIEEVDEEKFDEDPDLIKY